MDSIKTEPHIFNAPSGEIKASLYASDKAENKLAVVLPGAGYSCEKPLLYYSIEVLLENNFKVLTIEKVYGEDPSWMKLTSMEEALQYVEVDSIELFKQMSERFSAKIHTLLGRSLGTYAIACAVGKNIVRPQQIIWQTPSLNSKWNVIKDCQIDGFGIIGTADTRYKTAMPYLPKDTLVIENADHGMEISGESARSVEILKQVIVATNKWLNRNI